MIGKKSIHEGSNKKYPLLLTPCTIISIVPNIDVSKYSSGFIIVCMNVCVCACVCVCVRVCVKWSLG